MDEQEKQPVGGWHLDKKVSISHILTTVSMIVACGVVLAKYDTRLALLEQHSSTVMQDQRRQDEDAKSLKIEVKEALQQLNAKLDRLIERRER